MQYNYMTRFWKSHVNQCISNVFNNTTKSIHEYGFSSIKNQSLVYHNSVVVCIVILKTNSLQGYD